jgi:hypothetical protein
MRGISHTAHINLYNRESQSNIKMVSSIYSQVASFFFLFAAIFSDILLVRFCLVLGNLLLMVNAALGLPIWPNVINAPNVAIDVLVWSTLAFLLHLLALYRLLYDEKACRRFPEDRSESLFQFFHNRTGINRRDFIPILERGRWIEVSSKNTAIPTAHDLYLIVEGRVNCTVQGFRRRQDEVPLKDEPFIFTLYSGSLFEMRFANLFHLPLGFLNSSFRAVTVSDNVLLFAWSEDQLRMLSQHSPPVVVQAWKNLISFTLADIAHRPYVAPPAGTRHPDFLIPPEDDEKQPHEFEWYKQRFFAFVKWIIKSMDPRPPRGLRHKPVPYLVIPHDACIQPSKSSGELPNSNNDSAARI